MQVGTTRVALADLDRAAEVFGEAFAEYPSTLGQPTRLIISPGRHVAADGARVAIVS